MSTWHVWGDYYHTKPERIGTAKLLTGDDKAAQRTAEAKGFDFEKRMRNGFEPWAAAYESDKDDGLDFAFASYPVVRGWSKVS